MVKFTTLTPFSLLFSCRLSFPILFYLKISFLPPFALKSSHIFHMVLQELIEYILWFLIKAILFIIITTMCFYYELENSGLNMNNMQFETTTIKNMSLRSL